MAAGLWIRMDPHSFFLPDPDPHSICGSGYRRGKFEGKTEKVKENGRKLLFYYNIGTY